MWIMQLKKTKSKTIAWNIFLFPWVPYIYIYIPYVYVYMYMEKNVIISELKSWTW